MVSWHLLYLYHTQRGVKQFFVVAFQFYYTLCDVNAVFDKKQARKGFRPISASEGLLVRKVNNLINKRTEHWSCRIFVQQVK